MGKGVIVQVPGDVPQARVYVFVLLVWSQVYFLAILVWVRVCTFGNFGQRIINFWQFLCGNPRFL